MLDYVNFYAVLTDQCDERRGLRAFPLLWLLAHSHVAFHHNEG
jgi:hypothetical protein